MQKLFPLVVIIMAATSQWFTCNSLTHSLYSTMYYHYFVFLKPNSISAAIRRYNFSLYSNHHINTNANIELFQPNRFFRSKLSGLLKRGASRLFDSTGMKLAALVRHKCSPYSTPGIIASVRLSQGNKGMIRDTIT